MPSIQGALASRFSFISISLRYLFSLIKLLNEIGKTKKTAPKYYSETENEHKVK